LDYAIVSGPDHGGLSGAGSNKTYTPDADFNGDDSFTYEVTDRGDPDDCSGPGCDAALTSATKTVSISVSAVNDAPVAHDDSYAGVEDEARDIAASSLVSNDDDADGDALSVSAVGSATHGSVALSGDGATVTFTPASDFNGDATFSYTVSDGNGGSDSGEVTIDFAPVNDRPSAADGDMELAEDGSESIDLASLVSDVETSDANLSYAIVSGPDHGSLSGAGSNKTYTPDADFNGSDSFTYEVTDRGDPDDCSGAGCDAALTSATKTVSIEVSAVNDAPELDVSAASVTGQYSDSVSFDVSATDVDHAGADLSFSATSLPASLSLVDHHDGTATISGRLNVQQGAYAPAITVTDAAGATDEDDASITVRREDAHLEYTGDQIGLAGVNLTLEATVRDSAAAGYAGANPEPGGTIGDITKMWVRFNVYSQSNCGSGTPLTTRIARVADTGALGDGIGTARATYTSSSENTYCVVAELVGSSAGGTNQFYVAPNASSATVVFYNDLGQFVTGGGWIIDPNGRKGNFGFNARYNKNGQPQGQMVYVYRGTYQGVAADYVVKSNSLSALGFSGTTYPITARLQGKATIQINRTSDGAQLWSEGNATFTATATDTGQSSGIGVDSYSLTVTRSNGVVYKNVPNTLLKGGNVVVHARK
ncbi:MAG TPA: Ig-like domain-containing protein, partial [Actinomycetota bacterium]|nr:Ig-like domain-containing protein [Actinomycetota bacterium]